MEPLELRRKLSMTQTELANLIGVSQAAIAQYEAGVRTPGGRSETFYKRLRSAIHAPVATETVHNREVSFPTSPWTRVIDPEAIDIVRLPVRLDWTPRSSDGWHFHNVEDRKDLYRLLIDVGTGVDVQVFVDPAELVDWSDELLVSRRMRPVFDRFVSRIDSALSRV